MTKILLEKSIVKLGDNKCNGMFAQWAVVSSDIIVFTWSQYDDGNIETKTLAGLSPKAKKPTIEGGGDFLTWIPSINYPDPKVPI